MVAQEKHMHKQMRKQLIRYYYRPSSLIITHTMNITYLSYRYCKAMRFKMHTDEISYKSIIICMFNSALSLL